MYNMMITYNMKFKIFICIPESFKRTFHNVFLLQHIHKMKSQIQTLIMFPKDFQYTNLNQEYILL